LAYFTKPGQLVDYLTSEPIHKNDYFDKDEMLSEIAELETTQLKIMHTTLKEMYSNSKEVISDDGFALKDFMRAAKRGSIVLFQLANNITNHNIEKLLLQD
jgi:ketol-acid reductoisomerase